MIVIVDYGMCNIGSIVNMLKKTDCPDVKVTGCPEDILSADKIILPGVGTYDAGMIKLKKLKLDDAIIRTAKENNTPILGICLGMQLLGNSSEEGECEGLGLMDFDCRRIDPENGSINIPHMGWEYVDISEDKKNDLILKNLPDDCRFYFVHSYYAVCKYPEDVLMTINLGKSSLTVAVCKDNIYGMQFHPEKSHKYGMQLLHNFVVNA